MTSKRAVFVGDVADPTFKEVVQPTPEPAYDWNQAVRDYKAGIGDFSDEEAELLKALIANRAKAERPVYKGTTLYRFFDADGQLLYVGISLSLLMRFAAHKVDKDWWTQVASCTFEHVGDRQEAMQRELQAIRAEKPKYNRAGVPLARRYEEPQGPSLKAPDGKPSMVAPGFIAKEMSYYEKRRRLQR